MSHQSKVTSPTADIVEDKPILAVCVSTEVQNPIPSEHVALPWANPRHPRTGLNKPNVAKCNWLASISAASIIEVKGIVPAKQMAEIDVILRRLKSEGTGD
jgi:hypothetical protein